MPREGGFIKISRKLLEWEHSDNLGLTGFWIHLLLRANWENSKVLKQGELYLTYDGIADECGISRSTVRRYLNTLRESGEIKTTTERYRMKVRITNWKRFQQVQNEPPHEPPDEPPHEPPLLIKKNNKKNKNKRNSSSKEKIFTPPTADQVNEYATSEGLSIDADAFLDYNNQRNWMKSGKKIGDWKPLVRQWCELDKGYKKAKGSGKKDALPDWYDSDPDREASEDRSSPEEIEELRKLLKGEKE